MKGHCYVALPSLVAGRCCWSACMSCMSCSVVCVSHQVIGRALNITLPSFTSWHPVRKNRPSMRRYHNNKQSQTVASVWIQTGRQASRWAGRRESLCLYPLLHDAWVGLRVCQSHHTCAEGNALDADSTRADGLYRCRHTRTHMYPSRHTITIHSATANPRLPHSMQLQLVSELFGWLVTGAGRVSVAGSAACRGYSPGSQRSQL